MSGHVQNLEVIASFKPISLINVSLLVKLYGRLYISQTGHNLSCPACSSPYVTAVPPVRR